VTASPLCYDYPRESNPRPDIRIFFVSAVYPDVGVLFVVSLPFINKLQFYHEEHEDETLIDLFLFF
jgi:hypothetical protein